MLSIDLRETENISFMRFDITKRNYIEEAVRDIIKNDLNTDEFKTEKKTKLNAKMATKPQKT